MKDEKKVKLGFPTCPSPTELADSSSPEQRTFEIERSQIF